MTRRKRDDDVDLLTIPEFCRRNRISRNFYYQLQRAGIGPQETRLLSRVLISKAAAESWRIAREEETRKEQVVDKGEE